MSENDHLETMEMISAIEKLKAVVDGWDCDRWRHYDPRRHYDEEGNLIPAQTGAQRQRSYECKQSDGGKKRPGWWLSDEVIKAITDRQWRHVPPGWETKSDRIDAVLRYMLRIVEAVEAKARQTDRMPEKEVIDLVLEKIAAIELPPPLTEEEKRAKRLEFFKSLPPDEQRIHSRLFGNPEN